jgi:UDP-N-acetyl-D-glucosamine dehydrogenase
MLHSLQSRLERLGPASQPDGEARTAATDLRVLVIGLGYVGLPLLALLHEAGFSVLGFDIDPGKCAALKRGENYLPHLGADLARGFVGSPRFDAVASEEDLLRLESAGRSFDVAIICVPTPLGPHNEPDLQYVHRTGEMLGRVGVAGRLVILESTSFPGTTRHELLPALQRTSATGLTVGQNVLVAFSPEREDPGRRDFSIRTTPKLVGGLDDASTRAAVAVYRRAIERVVAVSSAEVAEASKVFENVFRCVNIALVNELKTIMDAMGINVWEVIEAASTKPFGFMPFYPGPGLGGHCIPIDPFYLTWKAKEFKVPARFIEIAGEVNNAMPHYVIHKVASALNDRSRAVRGSRVLVLGLAYKPDIADTRESPSYELIELLMDLGAQVDYSDPFVPYTKPVRKYSLDLHSVTLTPENLANYDCVLISTNHSAFDYALLAAYARLVVDTRNAMKPFALAMGDRLVRA